jgi:hypothetical protein
MSQPSRRYACQNAASHCQTRQSACQSAAIGGTERGIGLSGRGIGTGRGNRPAKAALRLPEYGSPGRPGKQKNGPPGSDILAA